MSDIITALGPGRELDSLTSFAPDYVTVRRAFNKLLVFPHLEAIEIGDTSESNLLSLVLDGNSRFSDLSGIDIELAKKVITYDSAFSSLVDTFKIQVLVKTLQPVAKDYADHARAHSKANLKFFADFSDYIASVNERIGSLDAVLAELDAQIQAQSEALANKNIVTTLWEALKKLYKLASTAEDSDVQIAALLNVAITTISGSFKSLFDNKLRLQKIISSLKGLRTRIRDLKTRFVALSAGLETVSISSQNLLDIWDDVAARMDAVAENKDSVPAPEAEQLKNAWAKVASDAKQYINTVSTSTVESHRVLTAKINAIPKFPINADEIRLHKLAAVYGDPVSALALCSRSSGTPISLAASDNDVVEKVLGPPAETLKRLKDLAENTGQVIEQFDVLLQQPFLDQYKCQSPIDNSESNLGTVMNFYRNQYLQLQQKTIPVAHGLSTYAQLQETLLPTVVPDVHAKEGDVRMSTFIDTNIPVVKQYRDETKELSKCSLELKNAWDNVVNLLQKLINECTQNTSTIQASIDKLTEQEKKGYLHAFLYGLGAFVAFTAAVFLPGGMLVGLAVGGALGGLAINEIIESVKLIFVINNLNGALNNATNSKARLEALLPYVEKVKECLSTLSLIWSDISSTLSTLATFYGILNGPTGPEVLEALRPKILNDWCAVQAAVVEYINVVAK